MNFRQRILSLKLKNSMLKSLMGPYKTAPFYINGAPEKNGWFGLTKAGVILISVAPTKGAYILAGLAFFIGAIKSFKSSLLIFGTVQLSYWVVTLGLSLIHI